MVVVILHFAIAAGLIAQQRGTSTSEAFQRLLQPGTTNEAAKQLLQRARSNPETKRYLKEHLPPIVEKGPSDVGEPWVNVVGLAGELRISEAVPALAKWIGFEFGRGTVDMASWAALDDYPAAKALSQIGDPAVPRLATILKQGTSEDRSAAVRALMLIGTPAAKTVLQDQLKVEQDPKMKSFIKDAIDHWRPPAPRKN